MLPLEDEPALSRKGVGMDQEHLGKEIAKFNLADAAIAEMSSRFLILTIEKDGYEVIHRSKMEVKGKRIEVEKKRKELKEDALRYGQAIDGEAKRLTALISPIEEHLEKEEAVYLTEKAAKKAEKDRVLAEKLQARVDRICAFGATFNGTLFSAYGIQVAHKALGACSDEGFERFVFQIERAKEAENLRLAEEKRIWEEEADRQQKFAAEQETERQRLELVARQQLEEQERLSREREDVEREKQKLIDEEAAQLKAVEDEKIRVAQEKFRAEELEKARIEAAAKALKDAEAKAEKARLAAERKAARQPDKVKMTLYLRVLLEVPSPELFSSEGLGLLVDIDQKKRELVQWAMKEVEAL